MNGTSLLFMHPNNSEDMLNKMKPKLKEREQRKLYMTLNLDSSICSDKCLNLTSSQNRTLKTEQSNQSMKSKQQRETNVIVELFNS